ncbi:hypothetical protein J7K25_04595, partial [bacterium]|nr:hypothetical protein [bacterium]
MNNQSSSKIWIIAIFVILVVGGIFGWQYFEAPKEVEKEIADRKTYRNEDYGYEFKYPQDYFLKEVSGRLLLRKTETKEGEWLIEVFVEKDMIDPTYDTSKMSFIEFAVDRIRA